MNATSVPPENTGYAVSPCINVCKMDAGSGLCAGCFRSLDEIAAWSHASNAARLRILEAVGHRRAGLDLSGSDLEDPRHNDCGRAERL